MIAIRETYPLQNDRRYPFYALVPKGFRENLKFRERVLRLGEESQEYRDDLWEMSRLDPIFWMNCFCFVNEPRAVIPAYREMPMITRAMQDVAIDQLLKCIPKRDANIAKSREVGASWIAMFLCGHSFLFSPNTNIGVVSAKEELVDSADNSSLFAKLDFMLDEKRMPWWLLPKERTVDGLRYRRKHLVFENLENGSTINGYACTGDVGRGGRKTWFVGDEPAFWPAGQDYNAYDAMQHNTRCRVMLSTPNLPSGAYYDSIHQAEHRDAELVTMDWKEDPEKRAGLYTAEAGKLKILDREFWASVLDCRTSELEDRIRAGQCAYRFQLSGETRSPYYDYEWGRASNPRSIPRELDRKFTGTGGTFFTTGVFDRTKELWGAEPNRRGHFSFDPADGTVERWHEDDAGSVLLWMEFVANLENPALGIKVPPEKRYILAADVAAGTGGSYSSNSVAVVVDQNNGEQVLEFATGQMRPDRFAKWCVGVAKFFNGALLTWDGHGATGSSFRKAVLEETDYGHLYHAQAQDDISGRETKRVGSFATASDKTKVPLLSALETAVDDSRYMMRSLASYAEVSQYVWKDGKVVHSTAVSTDDASAMKDAHGDRIIAHALAVEAMNSRVPRKAKTEDTLLLEAPRGTMAYRMQQSEERELELVSEVEW